MLENINNSSDLKNLTSENMKELAKEIRQFLVDNVSETGGHLASNLGVVELTLAIHKVFDLPEDKLIFDVGHQSYVHKILSGRRDFSGLRHEGGISGFPRMSESVYDAFGTGHSSTAPSAGLGIATALDLADKDNYTVVVIGDGAATGGLVYEALNNCRRDLKLIVILNENEMSISKNVGNMSDVISKIRSTGGYFSLKETLSSLTESIPLVGKPILKLLRKLKRHLKATFYSVEFLEQMGLKYFGPIDGNDYEKIAFILERAKKTEGSALVHVRTVKGKGYEPAELNPRKYHAVKPCSASQINIPSDKNGNSKLTFSLASGKKLCELAKTEEKLCVITAAMSDGTGISDFFENYPHRAFDVGIAEAHAVTFAAGLAAGGMIPVFAVYSSFLQRAYDNILHDLSLQNLHAVLLIDRAGISPDDGATHHGIWDIAFLSHMNNVNLYAPLSLEAHERYIEICVHDTGINAVRYAKGCPVQELEKLTYVGSTTLSDKSRDEIREADCVVITYGNFTRKVMEGAEMFRKATALTSAVIACEKLLPYSDPAKEISELVNLGKTKILIAEEGIRAGGFAVNLANALHDICPQVEYGILAIDTPPSHGDYDRILQRCGISPECICSALKNLSNPRSLYET